MTERINKILQLVFVGLLLIGLIISVGFNIYYKMNKTNQTIERIDTSYVETIDTLHDTIPQVKNIKTIKVITDTINHITENHDTVKITAEIPITQNEYSDDSTYTAWVSGYRPNLDSIHTYKHTIEKTITVYPKKTIWDKISLGVGIYGGYGIINKKPDIFIGAGIQYRLK